MQRVWRLVAVVAAGVLVVVGLIGLAGRPAAAQSEPKPRDQQIADLSTRVAVLEAQVADLSTRVAGSADTGADQAAAAQVVAPTEVASAPPPAPGGTTSREHPVPVGQEIRVGDWNVKVMKVKPDAWEKIHAENQFNDPPPDGKQFFMVGVSLTYVGPKTGSTFDLSWKTVDDGNVAYRSYDPSCGVIPDPLSGMSDVFPNGTFDGNVCFVVDSANVASLMMYVEPTLSFDSEPVWFALR